MDNVKIHEESIKFLLKQNEHYHDEIKRKRNILDKYEKRRKDRENSDSNIDYNSLTEGKITNPVQDLVKKQVKNIARKKGK